MSEAQDLVRSYLGNGGLFNPELMEHDKVRDMVMLCRDEIEHWHRVHARCCLAVVAAGVPSFGTLEEGIAKLADLTNRSRISTEAGDLDAFVNCTTVEATVKQP